MTELSFTRDPRTADGVIERDFALHGVPGILWLPELPAATAPLLLLGHPGGLEGMRARLRGRAQAAAVSGFASAAIELPGSGERTPIPGVQEARGEVRAALQAGEPVSADTIDRLILPLVEASVPEWRTLIDALQALPEIGGPVGYAGGVISIGVRLARIEPRVVAAGLFAGSFVPRAILAEAREVTIPLHVLLQWDDVGNDRQAALDLFDAFGSTEKSLLANMGGHTGVPASAGEHAGRFFERHLGAV
ncbi:alpha/beta hydrolase [Microbacterium sp. CJ88]|uniref:alpha/beta hydrolase n=1 Tax=Microbacterium sp. CJ88 TaxID=3445672 RepID=UPI003F65F4C1